MNSTHTHTNKRRKPGESFLPAEVCGNSLLLPHTLSPIIPSCFRFFFFFFQNLEKYHQGGGKIAELPCYSRPSNDGCGGKNRKKNALWLSPNRSWAEQRIRTTAGLYRGCEELKNQAVGLFENCQTVSSVIRFQTVSIGQGRDLSWRPSSFPSRFVNGMS